MNNTKKGNKLRIAFMGEDMSAFIRGMHIKNNLCLSGAFANSLLRSVHPCTLLNDEICA